MWNKKKLILSVTLTLLLCVVALPAAARVYIDINSPYLKKIPTAIPTFKDLGLDNRHQDLVKELAKLLGDTLSFTGFFKLLDPDSFLIDPQKAGLTRDLIKFENWRSIGAELLINGGISYKNGTLKIELRLFDTFGRRLIIGKRYTGHIGDRRKIIRRFCNEIIYHLTGTKGVFNTQIAFLSTTTGNKEIYLADFDGYNIRQFTNTKNITLSPAWSSDAQWLAYTAYRKKKPDIYIKHVSKNLPGKVIAFKGLNTTPVWVPIQSLLSATLSKDGNPEIYLLTSSGKIIKRLTYNWGIDTSPTWSPDGKRFAFVSNRSGTPQIYIKDLDKNQVRRLTYEGNYNTTPEWSPRGDFIAYSGVTNGHFNIFIIGVDGEGPYQLTQDTGDNESPTWSPDGTLIAFSSTREGLERIYVMNANGADQRRLLILSGEQTSPRWSPR
ncbi:MAG: Tol-Pal system beta propeller repeat protein TolB [Deltaproteobacteria bacterium]|nr:Tol-Pal system beta propeller repeat protein TolB [Deltaproteobacteria bacterium]